MRCVLPALCLLAACAEPASGGKVGDSASVADDTAPSGADSGRGSGPPDDTGDGDLGTSIEPPDFALVSLAGGMAHVCGLDAAGEAWCWGADRHAQATPPAGPFRQLAAGAWHTCGLGPDGLAVCWGLGRGAAQPVPEPLTDLACGPLHCCGLTEAGAVTCWGDESYSYGQFAPPSGTGWTDIAAGNRHSCATGLDGRVECWGRLGGGSPAAYGETAGGTFFHCGIRAEGFVSCWGDDHRGRATPPDTAAVEVVAGAAHACLRTDTGAVECWGAEAQLDVPDRRFTALAATSTQTCGVDADDGRAVCW